MARIAALVVGTVALIAAAPAAAVYHYERTFVVPKANDFAADPTGNVYVLLDPTTTGAAVRKYSPTGQLLASFVKRGDGREELSDGRAEADVATDREGNVYLSDVDHERILEFTPAGGFLRTLGEDGQQQGKLTFLGEGLTVAASNTIYASYRDRRSQGAYIGPSVNMYRITPGGEPELLDKTTDAFAPDPNAFLIDGKTCTAAYGRSGFFHCNGYGKVERRNDAGEIQEVIAVPAESGTSANMMATDTRGRLFLGSSECNQVWAYSETGALQDIIQFDNGLHAITVDDKGNVYAMLISAGDNPAGGGEAVVVKAAPGAGKENLNEFGCHTPANWPGKSSRGSSGGGGTKLGSSAGKVGPVKFSLPPGNKPFKGYEYRLYLRASKASDVFEKLTATIGGRTYRAGSTSGRIRAGKLYLLPVTIPKAVYNRIAAAVQAGKTVVMRAHMTVVSGGRRTTETLSFKI